MGTHTYQQTIKYELARDLLNGRRAIVSAAIGEAKSQASPDTAAIARLRADSLAISAEIRALDVTDEAALDAVIMALSRPGSATLLQGSLLASTAAARAF